MQFDSIMQEAMNKMALKTANSMHKIGDNVKGVAHVSAAHGAEQAETDVRMHVAKLMSLLVNTRRMIQINSEHGARNFSDAELIQNLDQAIDLISAK